MHRIEKKRVLKTNLKKTNLPKFPRFDYVLLSWQWRSATRRWGRFPYFLVQTQCFGGSSRVSAPKCDTLNECTETGGSREREHVLKSSRWKHTPPNETHRAKKPPPFPFLLSCSPLPLPPLLPYIFFGCLVLSWWWFGSPHNRHPGPWLRF